jgi:hypothetical protein
LKPLKIDGVWPVGINAWQRRARIAAGSDILTVRKSDRREPGVGAIVVVECAECGCITGKTENAAGLFEGCCDFCGVEL